MEPRLRPAHDAQCIRTEPGPGADSAADAYGPPGIRTLTYEVQSLAFYQLNLEGTDGVGFEPTTTWFRAKRSAR